MVIFSARVVTHVLHHCWRSKSLCVTGLCLFQLSTLAFCQPQQETQSSITANQTEPTVDLPIAELSEEERQQVKVAERFMTLLEKNPRRGTALDRVYSHHVEFGTIDKLLETLKQRTQISADDSVAWMLLGLFETNRGQFDSAVTALAQAEKLRTTDPLASYYLGLAQAAADDSASAAATLERAIERQPQRVDLQEFYQQLGRIHLRAQRLDEALAVWQRLEQLFPEDVRVLEEIATAMIQEERYEPAKPRYEKLLTLVQDDYRRTTYQLALADIAIQLGDKSSGIHKLEQLLGELKPDSWLFREARRRIDDTFLKAKDQDGLVTYYETWLSSHAEDLDGMSRLSRYLSSVARSDEARRWSEKAVALAPSRVDLRKSLIQLLIEAQDYKQAGEQYSQLVQLDPANVDHYRDWGKLVMRDTKLPMAERHKSALAIWLQMIEKSPNDALLVSQVADLCRQAENLESAEVYYRKAVELAPNEIQYREYLGEFLHQQKRPEEALAVWEAIIAGDRRTAYNLARVAEIYKNFKFEEQAVAAIAEASKLEPKDFALQIKAAKLHQAAEHSKQALVYLSSAESLASNDDERELVIAEKVQVLKISGALAEIANRLELELREAANPTAQQWYLLARYWEGVRQWVSAENALQKVIELEPRSIQARTLAARLAEGKGNKAEAAEKYRELASVDRRLKAEHWMKVCLLELASENNEAAYQAAKQVVQSAPNNPSYYEFFAQTCLKVGKVDEGMQAFRKAIRIDPGEWSLLLSLAKSLAEQSKYSEAIDLYHRAFDKSDELDDKLEIIAKLTPLYSDQAKSDQLIQRLEMDRQDPQKHRISTICLAQVYRLLSQTDDARKQLESLYQPTTTDTLLLNQLSKICQETKDIKAAIKYQRQLVAVAPGAETELPLAHLLTEIGEIDEAQTIFSSQIVQESDPVRQIAGIDALINNRRSFGLVNRITGTLLLDQPDDWELIYRHGVAAASLPKEMREAKEAFQRLLKLSIPGDELSRREKERRKKSPEEFSLGSTNSWAMIGAALNPAWNAAQRAVPQNAAQRAVPQRQTTSFFSPNSFEQARVASLGWLHWMSQGGVEVELLDELRTRAKSTAASLENLYDGLYLALVRGDSLHALEYSRRLASIGGEAEKQVFLNCLYQNHLLTYDSSSLPMLINSSRNLTNEIPKPTVGNPIDLSDLELALKIYKEAGPELRSRSLDVYSPSPGGPSQTTSVLRTANNRTIRIVRGANGLVTVMNAESQFEFLHRLTKQIENKALAESLLEAALVDAKPVLMLDIVKVLVRERQSQRAIDVLRGWPEAYEAQPKPTPAKFAAEGQNLRSQLQSVAEIAFQHGDASVMGELAKQALPVLAKFSKMDNQQSRQYMNVIGSSFVAGANLTINQQGVPQYVWTPPNTPGQANVPQRPNQSGGANVFLQPISFRNDCLLLSYIYQALTALNAAQSLEDYIRQMVDERNVGTEDVFWNIYLANIQCWKNEYAKAIDTIQPVIAMFPEDTLLALSNIQLYELAGKYADALRLAQNLDVKDVTTIAIRDLKILNLALSLNDRELGIKTAKQLNSQSLPISMKSQLVQSMTELGMYSEAQQLRKTLPASRVASSAPGMSQQLGAIRSRAQVISIGQANQLLDSSKCLFSADEISDVLLQKVLVRTSVAVTERAATIAALTSGQSSSNPSLSASRNGALHSLQSHSEMANRIKVLEGKVKISGSTLNDRMLLIESQLYAADKKAATEGLRELLKAQPDSRAFRFLLAGLLWEERQTEGFEMYLSLLKDHPKWMIDSKCQLAPRIYWNNDQLGSLVRSLREIDPTILSANSFVLDLAQSLFRDEQLIDQGMELVEHLAKAYQSSPQRFLTQFIERDSWLWKNERFFQLVESLMLPDENAVRLNPWFGTEAFVLSLSPYTRTGTGTGANVSFYFRFMDSIVRSSRQERWKASLDARLAKHPKWLGGYAFKIGCESFLNGNSINWEATAKLFQDQTVRNTVPLSFWSWIYEHLPRTKPLPFELMLIETGISRKFSVTNDPNVSKRIAEFGELNEQRLTARNLLHKQLSGYPEAEYNKLAIAQMLSRLGYHLDAIEILSNLQAPRIGTRLKASVESTNGGLSNSARVAFELSAAIAKNRGNLDPVLYAEQLFIDNVENSPARRLLTMLPRTRDLFTSFISCPAIDQFVTIGMRSDGAKLVHKLEELRKLHPSDVRLAVLESLLRIRSGKYPAEKILPSLKVVHNSITTDGVGESANSVDSIVYWIVAAALFQSAELRGESELQQMAEEMANHSLTEARQKSLVDEEVALLAEWGSLLELNQQQQAAEEKWRQILTPIGGANADGFRKLVQPDQASVPQDASPMGLSQFHGLIALSNQAHLFGMEALRSDVLKLAFGPNAPESTPEVAEALRGMLANPDHSSIENHLYPILKQTVFPPNRDDRIEFHGRLVSKNTADVIDLATILIDKSKRLGELDSIEQEIDRRSGDKIAQLSLRIISRLAQDRQQDVPALLEELTNELKTSNLASQQQTLPAAIAALRALQAESLKEPATRLLVKLGYKAN